MARRRPGPKLPAAIFIAEDRQKAYEVLKSSTRAEDKQLFAQLQKAIGTLKEDVFAGIQIPRDRIPAEYHRKFPNLESLWKLNLTRNWRLVYSVAGVGRRVGMTSSPPRAPSHAGTVTSSPRAVPRRISRR